MIITELRNLSKHHDQKKKLSPKNSESRINYSYNTWTCLWRRFYLRSRSGLPGDSVKGDQIIVAGAIATMGSHTALCFLDRMSNGWISWHCKVYTEKHIKIRNKKAIILFISHKEGEWNYGTHACSGLFLWQLPLADVVAPDQIERSLWPC